MTDDSDRFSEPPEPDIQTVDEARQQIARAQLELSADELQCAARNPEDSIERIRQTRAVLTVLLDVLEE